jgi:hypothetical protein
MHGTLTPLDPSLTLTRMQYPAIVGKAEKRNLPRNAAIATPCKSLQRLTDHS